MARRKWFLLLSPLLLLRQDANFAVQRRLMSELNVGEKVSGVVSHVTGSLVLVDVGVEKEGLLPNSKMTPGSSSAEVAVGEELELWVSQVKNEENLRRSSLILSSDSQKVFSPCEPDTLQELNQLDPSTWLRGFVVARRPFGLLVSVAPPGARGARAVGAVFEKGAPQKVGSQVKVRIQNLDLEKQRLTLTMKDGQSRTLSAVMESFQNSSELRGRVLGRGKFGVFVAVRPEDGAQETVGLLRKEQVSNNLPKRLDDLKLGQELEGVVVRTTPEMTLVDVGLKQRGLLPPSKMGDRKVHVGDRLQVWVSELKPNSLILASDAKKVLSVKSLGRTGSVKDYELNAWYQAVVLRLSPFGAFMAVQSSSKRWAEGLLKTNQIQGHLELGSQVQVRVMELDGKRMSLSMRSVEDSKVSARFAALQKLRHEIFPARVIDVEEEGARVEFRHPETGSILGWLSSDMQKGLKPLEPGEDIEVKIVDIDMEKYDVSLSMTLVPRGIQHEDFASLIADELGEDVIDILREGDEVQVKASTSKRGMDLSLA